VFVVRKIEINKNSTKKRNTHHIFAMKHDIFIIFFLLKNMIFVKCYNMNIKDIIIIKKRLLII